MNKTRTQLTMFLDHYYSAEIECVRKKYDPVQYKLIISHVTLCREDEIEDLTRIKLNLSLLDLVYLTINFDQLIRFADQKGVMMVSEFNNQKFHHLISPGLSLD